MARKRSRATETGKRARAPAGDLGARLGRAALVVALLASALVVDPRADNAFDAPKRLLALAATAAAAVAVFGLAGRSSGTTPTPGLSFRAEPSTARRVVLVAAAGAVVLAGIAALLSPRRAIALDAYRAIFLYALLLPLGASRALQRPHTLLAVFLAATAINAGISLLQAAGAYSPFALRVSGGRESTGAFAGNVGYLAIALALAAVAALALALYADGKALRLFSAGLAVLFLAALLVNQNLTALTALFAGSVLLAFLRWGRRAWPALAMILVVLTAGVLLYRPLRTRAGQAIAAVRTGDFDRLVTYRTGAWLAAVEMTRERPITGVGPGVYGAEFVPHRLQAEIRAQRRFVNPLVTSSYAEAHSDYLQPFAETGVVGGMAVLVAAGVFLFTLIRAAFRMEGARRAEIAVVAGILIAGATAALTWFPMQRSITVVPLLLAAGRGWRLSAEEAP